MLKTLDVQRRDFFLDPSLALYLPLHELDGKSFTSKDAYGRDCAFASPNWVFNGHSFDGANFIDVGMQDFASKQGSILAWAKQDTQLDDKLFVGRNTAGTDVGELVMLLRSSGFGSKAVLQIVDSTPARSVCRSDDILLANTWYFIAAIWNVDDINILYIDGKPQNVTTAIGRALPAHASLSINIGGNANAGSFVGDIGDVMIYNRALNVLEIQAIYLKTKWRYQ